MALVVFYEKPSCATNARQKKLLAASGHQVETRSLLTENWTAEGLLEFFGATPVTSWFNPAAPRVKSGEVDPGKTEPLVALGLMLRDPLLIRRPLMEIAGKKYLGFDTELLSRDIGLIPPPDTVLDGCSHGGNGTSCASPPKSDNP